MIEIYGKDNCPYCDKAKALCERKGLDYQYKLLSFDFTREEMFTMFPTARTFPQIKVDGNAIGGYTELEEIVNIED
jgi:glutaredoxin 3